MEQIKSKERVVEHGEVFTSEREVNAMLNLVKQETLNIESTFLEPACGSGNFLLEVLARKLQVVKSRYKKSQLDYERYTFIAISSLYGIELLYDNVLECRIKLYSFFDTEYTNIYKKQCKKELRASIRFLLERNIICGNALTLLTNDDEEKPIIFSQWSSIGGNKIKRKDFYYKVILNQGDTENEDLFSNLDRESCIPMPKIDYSPTNFLKIANAKPIST